MKDETIRIFGISKEDYQGWKHDQVSKIVLKFLADKQEYLKQAALDSWVDGSKSFADCNQTIRGQIIELNEIIELPFEAMVEFYRKEEDGNDRINDKTANEAYSQRSKTTSPYGY